MENRLIDEFVDDIELNDIAQDSEFDESETVESWRIELIYMDGKKRYLEVDLPEEITSKIDELIKEHHKTYF